MGYTNITVTHNGDNISNIVLSYTRRIEICNGVGTFDLIVVNNDRVYEPWDILVLYEGINKIGTYYIYAINYNMNDGSIILSSQDGSKRLQDFFIDETSNSEEGDTTGPWIQHFLYVAGVTAFGIGAGVPLAPDTSMGMTSAYDQVVQLLEYSGWYMYFNESGICVVGKMVKGGAGQDSPLVFNDNVIVSLVVDSDDSSLRNRAIVLGSSTGNNGEPVYVEITVHLPWNYDANDIRTVVMANSYIYNEDIARKLANMIIDELTIVKTIDVAGASTAHVGNACRIVSQFYNVTGKITTVESKFSGKDGLVTTILVDEKCPRLFSFWGEPENGEEYGIYRYVYTGHWGDGIYRKMILPASTLTVSGAYDVFQNFSYGLENTYIVDLSVGEDVLATVADDGYVYVSISGSSWNKIQHPELLDETNIAYSGELVKAVACSIGKDSAGMEYVVAGYNYYDPTSEVEEEPGRITSFGRSWVTRINPYIKETTYTGQVVIPNSIYNVNIEDVSSYAPYVDLVTTRGHYINISGVGFDFGYRNNQGHNEIAYPDHKILNVGFKAGTYTGSPPPSMGYSYNDWLTAISSVIIDISQHHIAYLWATDRYKNGHFIIMDLSTWTETKYVFDMPSAWDDFWDDVWTPTVHLTLRQVGAAFELSWDDWSMLYTPGDTSPQATFIEGRKFMRVIDGQYITPEVVETEYIPKPETDEELEVYVGYVMHYGFYTDHKYPVYVKYTRDGYWSSYFFFHPTYHLVNRSMELYCGGNLVYQYKTDAFYGLDTSLAPGWITNTNLGLVRNPGLINTSLYDFKVTEYVNQSMLNREVINFFVLVGFPHGVAIEGSKISSLSGDSWYDDRFQYSIGPDSYWDSGSRQYYSTPYSKINAGCTIMVREIKGSTGWFLLLQNSSANIIGKISQDTFIERANGDPIEITKANSIMDDSNGTIYLTTKMWNEELEDFEYRWLLGVSGSNIPVAVHWDDVQFKGAVLIGGFLGNYSYTQAGPYIYYKIRNQTFRIYDISNLRNTTAFLSPVILKHSIVDGNNTTLKVLNADSKIDYNLPHPIEVYDIPPEVGLNSEEINESPIAETDGWLTRIPEIPIYDLTTYKSLEDQFDFVAIATTNSIKAYPINDPVARISMFNFTEDVTNIDYSKRAYTPDNEYTSSSDPIIIASLRASGLAIGAPGSGIFWQKVTGDEYIREGSSGLPSSEITVIQIDGRL